MTAEATDFALLALQLATLVLVIYGAYLSVAGFAWRDEKGVKKQFYEATPPESVEAGAGERAKESSG